MTFRARITLVVVWAVSLVLVGVLVYAQAPIAQLVPLPTPIASTSARKQCTWRFAGAELSCVRRPGDSAMRPSMLVAALRMTNGRCSRIIVKNG